MCYLYAAVDDSNSLLIRLDEIWTQKLTIFNELEMPKVSWQDIEEGI
jgi:hypothetical protein